MEVNQVKAWWKVSDKPRGRWNPLFEFGIHLTNDERSEVNRLNVPSSVNMCLIFDASVHDAIPDYVRCGQGNLVLSWPECPRSADARAADSSPLWSGGCCRDCRFPDWRYAVRTSIILSERYFVYRLPWRPGGRPDYSDFIEPTRRFLQNLLEELERRVAEARESSPSDEWGTVEEEFESYSVRQTETVAVAERKLRVIRA